MISRFLFLLILPIIILWMGCISSQSGIGGKDETSAKVVIGYVNTDPIHLISIEKRIDDVLKWLRSEKTIFFQPSPDDLLKLANISLKREIRKVGTALPGMKIDYSDIRELSSELALEKGNKIADMLRQRISIDEINREMRMKLLKLTDEVKKGQNEEYDEDIFNAKDGDVIGPLMLHDRAMVIRVDKLWKDVEGNDMAEILPITIYFDNVEAQSIIEDKFVKTWNVRINNKFYEAIGKFYSNDIDGAKSDLAEYTRKNKLNLSLAHYLMYKIYMIQYNNTHDDNLLNEAMQSLNEAIKTSKNAKLPPYFHYELGGIMILKKDTEEAKKVFRTAFDELRSDIYLTEQLINVFDELGDNEYRDKAMAKKADLDQQIKKELSLETRRSKSKPIVMTGEGPLYEDPEEIWNETKMEKKEDESQEEE